jgi:hypothetical protein
MGGYSKDILGGVLVDTIYAKPPIFVLLRYLGLDTIASLNWTLIFLQTLICFLATEAALPKLPPSRQQRALLSVMGTAFFAFMPVLGWRISRGHLNLYQGALVVAASFALYELLREKRFHSWHAVAFALVMVNGLEPAAGQTLTYGVVFALPILAVMMIENPRAALAALSLCGLGALLCLPGLVPFIHSLRAGDILRARTSQQFVYSYITTSIADLRQIFLWNFPIGHSDRPEYLHHEAYYSLGPLVPLALGFYLRQRRWMWFSACLAMVILSVSFAMHIEPISQILMAVFSPLKMFRVPSRAFIIVGWTLTFFAVQMLFRETRHDNLSRTTWGLLVGGIIAMALLPLPVLEILMWLVAFAFVILRNHLRWQKHAVAALGWLAFGSFLAFRTTLYLPLADLQAEEQRLARIHATIEHGMPQLLTPLVRTQVASNSAALLGLSSINGYWFALPPFARLMTATEGDAEMDPGRLTFETAPSHPGFEILKDLYNIQAILDSSSGQLQLHTLASGPALWASSLQQTFKTYSELVESLRHAPRFQTQWLINGPGLLAAPINPACTKAQFSQLHWHNDELTFHVESPAQCPATVSANYHHQVTAFDHTHSQAVPTYLADGALVGLTIPEGASDIEVSFYPAVSFGWIVFAVLIFVGYLLLAQRLVLWI